VRKTPFHPAVSISTRSVYQDKQKEMLQQRDDLRRFKKRKASEKSSISVAERRQLLEARPTINFRDPIRNAQLDVRNLYC
jgi:hypothetical protein